MSVTTSPVEKALFFAMILLGRVGHGLHGEDYQAELAREIVDAHMRSLRTVPTNGTASMDERAVKEWLDREAGFAVPVRDFANYGFGLKGGRGDFIEGRSVAVLLYCPASAGNGESVHPLR